MCADIVEKNGHDLEMKRGEWGGMRAQRRGQKKRLEEGRRARVQHVLCLCQQQPRIQCF